jgi:transketolase
VDGHDVEALVAPTAVPPNRQPLVVLAYTDPCAGMPPLEARRPKLHYVRFKDAAEREQFAAYLGQL